MSSARDNVLSVGICGLGTVGRGTLNLLQSNQAELEQRLGFAVNVVHVASRSLDASTVSGVARTGTDPFEVINNPAVDVVVETIGGFDPAFDLVSQALSNGKHVVTANKALIAERGNELFPIAREHGVELLFESAVAGGIPIIKALREGLAANRINWIAGIINGTGNFILSEMTAHRRQFSDVLAEAQQLGYAEADPTFDVEGIDAAHKLTIMASIAFGIPLQFEKTYTEGISMIIPEDISYAKELGYRIKHLGIARRTSEGVEIRVHPTLIPRKLLLAHVNGVGNAIMINGDAVGSTLYNGPGAGAEATGSAVVADIIDIGRRKAAQTQGICVPELSYAHMHNNVPVLKIEDIESEYYLRIPAKDRVGVMARISTVLESQDISIEAVIQKEAVSETVPIVILTHAVLERKMNDAIKALEQLDDVTGDIMRIRVEPFHGAMG